MDVLRFGAVIALTAGLSGASAMAQDGGGEVPSAHFQLRTSARVVVRAEGERPKVVAAFAGGGRAVATRRNIVLNSGQLSQRDGDGTLDLAPSGPLKKLRRSRVYIGRGTASASIGERQAGFDRMRIAAHIRGSGDRLRLLGKFHGRQNVVADGDTATEAVRPKVVLNGRFRGQLAPSAPAG
jgi:hypothetical protein